MTKPILRLQNVGYTYKAEGADYTALSDVSLDIFENEFTAIIGPSGSGKSTLLNLLGLLSRPTTGQMNVFDHPLDRLSESQLAEIRNRHIGFVFQSFLLVARLTVLENILLPCAFETRMNAHIDLLEDHRHRALEMLRSFGLEDLAHRFPHELSGGQKQRVAICRALLFKPRVILADEPTGALDSASSKEVMRMLGELHARGSTVVMITHDPDVAAAAQRIISIHDGRLTSDERRPGSKTPTTLPGKECAPFSHAMSGRNGSFVNFKHMFWQSLTLATRSLKAHRGRSILTGLGLLIGVLSLIIIDGLGEIVQNSFNKLFYTSSVRKAYIFYDSDRAGFHGGRSSSWRGLQAQTEFPRLAQMFTDKGVIRPFLRSGTCLVRNEGMSFRTRLSGVSDPDEFLEMDTPLKTGRWPSSSEFSTGSSVAVLGIDTIDQLFGITDPRRREPQFPLGERVTVDNCNTLVTLTIVGVLGRRDTSFGNRDANDIIYVPINTLLNRMGPTFFTWFSVLPREGFDSRHLADEVTTFLSLQSGGKLTFGSSLPADILDRVRGFLTIVQAIVGFIGALCLFVGGIGIMNMMLVTVAERTREIGLLKCLGAQNFHIKSLILTESVVLCFWSGCLAVLIGVLVNNGCSLAVSWFVPMLKDFRWIMAPVGLSVGLVVSIACGLGFGALPAARAATLDPADCLRSE